MSKLMQVNNGNKIGVSSDLKPFFTTATGESSNFRVKEYSFNNTGAIVGGTQNSCRVKPLANDMYKVEKIFLDCKMNNAHATATATFWNPVLLLQEIEVMINNKRQLLLSDYEIFSVVGQNLKKDPRNIYHNLNDFRTELDNTFTGETCGALSSLEISIPINFIDHVFDNWNVRNPNQPIEEIEIRIKFKPDSGTALENTAFIKSSAGATNVWSSITFSDMKLRVHCVDIVDVPLRGVPSLFWVVPRVDVYKTDLSWNGTSDNYKFTLADKFPKRELIQGVSAFAVSRTIADYADVTACKVYSGADFIGFKINKVGSSEVTDFSGTANKTKHRRYLQQQQLLQHGEPLPLDVWKTSATGYAVVDHFMPTTYVNFNCYEKFEFHENVVAGVSTKSGDDYEITFDCISAVDSSTRLYIVQHYLELQAVDGSGNLVTEIPIKNLIANKRK